MFLLLDSYATGGRYLSFFGAGAGTASNRPLLTIDYTPVPEPGSLMLLTLGIAGLWFARQRRK